jgi:hypothetical protein
MVKFESEEQRQITRLRICIDFYDDLIDFCIEHRMKHSTRTYNNIMIFVLSNDIKEIGKSILALYESNSRIGIDALNRIAFEKYLYFLYIGNSENRAKACYLKLQMRQYELMTNLLYDNAYKSSFSKLIGKNIDTVTKELIDKYPDFDENKNRIIEEYRSCFDYIISDENIFRHRWYNFNGKIKSIKKLAEEVKVLDEYTVQYDINSSEVHSSNLKNYYKFFKKDDQSYFAALNDEAIIREVEGVIFISLKLFECISILFEVFRIPKKTRQRLNELILPTIDVKKYTIKKVQNKV